MKKMILLFSVLMGMIVLAACDISGSAMEGRAGVSGATVRLSGPLQMQTVTDANGHYIFAFDNLSGVDLSQPFTITIEKEGYRFSPRQQQIHFTANTQIADINFTAEAISQNTTVKPGVRYEYDALGRILKITRRQ